MATLGTLVTQVGERMDDEAHRRFTQTNVRTWVMEGAREVARRAECLYGTDTVAVTAGTQDVVVATDIVRIHFVTFVPDADSTQTYPLDYYDLADMDTIWGTWKGSEAAYPEFYTTWGHPPDLGVQLAPVPSASGELNMYYFKFPTALSTTGSDDGQQVELPTGWEDLAVDWACGKCALKDKDVNGYNVWMQTFTDKLKALMDTAVRYNDSPGQMTPDRHWSATGGGGFGFGGYGGGYW